MSTNSSLISSGTTIEELSLKYQKLLQEYNRIRAQHSVLRKAIVNEQNNNTALINELKSKENDLRKHSLEIDNLMFHNRGLNKKIEVLQEEGPKKKSTSWLPNNQLKKEMEEIKIALDAAVLDLENKIHENESLYLELDEIKSNHQNATDELKSQNQSLQLKISQILNDYEHKIKDYEDGLTLLKQEKSSVEMEMFKVLETMKSLSETPIQFNNSTTSDDVFLSSDMLEFLQNLKDNEKIQTLEGDDYTLLFNFAQKFIKDLTSRLSWNEFMSGLNLLLKDLRLFLDLQENQMIYINENWKNCNLAETIVKIKDSQRAFDQSFHQILPDLASIFNQSHPYSWIAHSDDFLLQPTFQAIWNQLFPIFTRICDLLSICLNNDHSQEFLSPQSSEYLKAVSIYKDNVNNLSQLCNQFLSWQDCNIVQLFTLEKASLLKWSREFKSQVLSLFNHHCHKLQTQNISIEDHWYIKACNVQTIGMLSNLKTSFDRVFSMCVIWLETFTNIDLHTIDFILSLSEQNNSKIEANDQNKDMEFSIEAAPSTTFIPYTATLKLLTENLAFKEEKDQLLKTLQNEMDTNQSQSQTIYSLKQEITSYESTLQEEQEKSTLLQSQINEISEVLTLKEEELSTAIAQNQENEDRIAQLNSINYHEAKTLINGKHIEQNDDDDDDDDDKPLKLVSKKTNGTNDTASHLNGMSHDEFPIKTQESVESPPPEDSVLSKDPSSNQHITNLFNQSYEIQIQNLMAKLELSQAQTIRLHQAMIGNNQILKDSQLEKKALQDQIESLTQQLEKTKEDLSTVEQHYQDQITVMSERFAQGSLI